MKTRFLLLLLALAAFTLAGCSDSSGSGNTPDTQDASASDDTSAPDDVATDADDTTAPDVPVDCDSDDECTTTAACAVSACVDGTCQDGPVEDGTECDDGVGCTVGVCASGACTSGDLEAGWCQIGGTCYGDAFPNPENSCEECAAATATDAWTVDDTNTCDDGVACTNDACLSGVCTPTADDALCDDDNPCTVDSCDVTNGCQLEELDSGESCGTGMADPAFCWSGGECTLAAKLKGEYGNTRVHHLRFSPDGRKLAVASNGSLSVWAVPSMT